MNVNEIEKQGFILALFIRDDKKRFLLGSGAYEFKDSQLHFSANTMANDVVEVQGNDGCLLAGQVRRPTTQVFDGYIGDATVNRSEVESYRKDFLAFFQKNHFYTVVYVFPDGSTIQRRRGFIVDCGEIKELYQIFPTYHIGFNFEDVNYYKYSENDLGEETYGKLADIGLSVAVAGGLVWEDTQSGTDTKTGVNITFDNSIAGDFEDLRFNGDTTQQTYTGKNKLIFPGAGTSIQNGIVFTANSDGTLTLNGQNNNNGNSAYYFVSVDSPMTLPAGTYTVSGMTGTQTITFYDGNTYYDKTEANPTLVLNSATTFVNIYFQVRKGDITQYTDYKVSPMVEQGSTATSFEPYVGGIASPNPDYPQTVHTVSGEQIITISDGNSQSQSYTVDLTGKNLFDKSQATQYRYLNDADGTITTSANSYTYAGEFYIPCKPNTSYTLSGGTAYMRIAEYNSSKTFIQIVNSGNSADPITITTGANGDYLRVSYNDTTGTADIQLEKGSTATAYVPYNPIELCKIGTYQDYIYKSGDDWYVHKETGKVLLNGTENWSDDWQNSETPNYWITYLRTVDFTDNYQVSGQGNTLCDYFVPSGSTSVWNTQGYGFALNSNATYTLQFKMPKTFKDNVADWKTWLGSHHTSAYFVLATPTDTKITDSTLIGQLEAVLGAGTYSGTTIITVSGVDLASPLTVEALVALGGGVEWDNYGAVWEEGGGGMTVVNVDSIENVYPVWTVVGPTNNPTLENLTTNTTIAYSGNVALGQTLVVDMLNETAKLNGTSVIGNISGKWLEFAPGNNRISFTATNSDAPNSTIEWQEIVG